MLKRLTLLRRVLRGAAHRRSEPRPDEREASAPIRRIHSADGRRRLDIELLSHGLYRFVELTEYPGDEYIGPYTAPSHFSGLYDSADAAERDARLMLPWLQDRESGTDPA